MSNATHLSAVSGLAAFTAVSDMHKEYGLRTHTEEVQRDRVRDGEREGRVGLAGREREADRRPSAHSQWRIAGNSQARVDTNGARRGDVRHTRRAEGRLHNAVVLRLELENNAFGSRVSRRFSTNDGVHTGRATTVFSTLPRSKAVAYRLRLDVGRVEGKRVVTADLRSQVCNCTSSAKDGELTYHDVNVGAVQCVRRGIRRVRVRRIRSRPGRGAERDHVRLRRGSLCRGQGDAGVCRVGQDGGDRSCSVGSRERLVCVARQRLGLEVVERVFTCRGRRLVAGWGNARVATACLSYGISRALQHL